jgi:ABC-type bacteriocin/lantibiotic exporter with double-glycine peptidase domain
MSDADSKLPSVEETLRQFEQILGSDVHEVTRSNPLGEVYAACQAAARLLGLSGTPVRGGARPDAPIGETAGSFGLLDREVALSGLWWKHDHGILIVKEAESGRPLLLRSCLGTHAMEFSGPEQFVKFRPLTRAAALGLQTRAVALCPVLPDDALSFGAILAKVLKLYPFEVATYLVLTIVVACLTYAVPVASGLVVNHAVPHRNETVLLAIVAVVVSCNLIMLALRYTSELIVQRLEAGAGTLLQAGLLDRIFRMPLKFFAAYSSADLMMRFTGLETSRRTILRMLVTSSMDLITVLVGLCTLAYYYPLGALAVLVIALLTMLLAALIGRISFAAYSEGEAMTANVLTIVYELVANMLPIRMFGAQKRAFLRWRDNFIEMRRRTVRSTNYSNLFSAVQQSLSLVTLSTVFAIVAYTIKDSDSIPLGHYVAFIGSLSLVSGSGSSLTSTVLASFNLSVSITRSAPILESLPETVAGRKRPQPLSGEVDLSGVHFRYSAEGPLVLSNFSLLVKPGQYIGIVGSSGCGKSTLVRLLLGILTPTQGQIYIDRNDLGTVNLDEIRQQIGLVLQDYHMFSGSILDNIAAGREFEVGQVLAVLDTIGMGSFVKALPMGIHTFIGEGTTGFSGGQVQLMALARALVGDPKLLIIDEATSALDNLSVKKVNDLIDALPITRIVFTHRLGTLKNCDLILVMDQGRIVEQGTFKMLLAQENSLFQAMLQIKQE